MENVYTLNSIKGAFLKSEEFGFYFITEKTKLCFDFYTTSFEIKDMTISLKNGEDFIVYKIPSNDEFIYLFALKEHTEFEVHFVTLEEVATMNSFLWTPIEILDALSIIGKLPNGNYICRDVQGYITAIEAVTKKYMNKEHFFRGHYNYKYTLSPSLYRKKQYYNNEDLMYMDFKTQFYNELSHKKYIEILTTMQHYKMPTRLLDTTSNPLVALYMACDKPVNYKGKSLGVGEVITMNEDIKNIKYSDSNAITLLSALAVLETNYKQELYEKIIEAISKKDPSIYRNSLAYRRFVAEVHSELPLFDESFFTPEVLLKPRHVKVGMINERIIAQSGNFILFGLCNYITGEYMKLDTISKERIFIIHREQILKQLELLNITSGTMYPDKDHMSLSITNKYE